MKRQHTENKNNNKTKSPSSSSPHIKDFSFLKAVSLPLHPVQPCLQGGDTQFIFYSKSVCVCSVVLEQRQQVVIVVVREVRRSEVRQQLVRVGQLGEQLWRRTEDTFPSESIPAWSHI